jgi:hypothetical protein
MSRSGPTGVGCPSAHDPIRGVDPPDHSVAAPAAAPSSACPRPRRPAPAGPRHAAPSRSRRYPRGPTDSPPSTAAASPPPHPFTRSSSTLETFLADAAAADPDGEAVPQWVEDDFRAYSRPRRDIQESVPMYDPVPDAEPGAPRLPVRFDTMLTTRARVDQCPTLECFDRQASTPQAITAVWRRAA